MAWRFHRDFGNKWRNKIGCGDVPRVWRDVELKEEGCIAQWYANHTYIPRGQKVTLPDDLRSWKGFCPQGSCLSHPWAAPGTAPLASPCGVDGGNAQGCPAGNPGKGGCAAGGYGHGPDARDWYQNWTRPVTSWPAGSVQNMTWGVLANHGGGYSFRLCKMPESGMLADLTEECFQAGALDFVGDTSVAVYDDKDRTEFEAKQVKLSTGMWRRNPAPACAGPGGGSATGSCSSALDTQFPPPVPGMYGFSGNGAIGGKASKTPLKKWKVIDQVQVPNLPAGQYVLSFRVDSEQTAQTWSNCADIKITNDGPTPPTPTPTPSPPAPTPTPSPPAPTPTPSPPAPTPTPSPPAPTPTPTPSSFTCDQCVAQGHKKDACNCGVCGSFGLCTWTCSPGGQRVACDKGVPLV